MRLRKVLAKVVAFVTMMTGSIGILSENTFIKSIIVNAGEWGGVTTGGFTYYDAYYTIGDETLSGKMASEYSGNAEIIEIPEKVNGLPVIAIGRMTFSGCSNLTSISIPDSVISIGEEAFKNCSSLTSITISDSVKWIGSDAFYNTAWYNAQPDGIVYFGKCLYTYKGKMPDNTSIEVEDGTTGIAGSAFRYCSRLTEIIIPDSVTRIGDSAFKDCTGLTEITIPNSVTSIGHSAFKGCTGLTEITIPESVTWIQSWTFDGCTGITDIIVLNPDCAFSNLPPAATVHGYENSLAQKYAEEKGLPFVSLGKAPTVFGDINSDGEFTVADVVLLQKWLLAVPDVKLADWEAADLCEDGRLDVFDLCMMKRMLVENS